MLVEDHLWVLFSDLDSLGFVLGDLLLAVKSFLENLKEPNLVIFNLVA